ncbi:T-cell surface antigen CD2 [Echinops telfairi]|uniref:T-cell surface antigen CD2 n=1 Tax=Echinops telfairi TaxID=9371 RepID=A0ABM0J4Z3_ECHTE|nr:T-cell surface antigen CD2 [Echinops telfairi]
MHLPCNILASVLLLCNWVTKGMASEMLKDTLGILDHDVTLDFPGLKMDTSISDIRWYKGETKTRIALLKDQKRTSQKEYELLQNGSLRIKNLTADFNDIYKVEAYDANGKNLMESKIRLTVLERVSVPVISWNCVNRTLTCKVMKGSEPELQLLQNGTVVKRKDQQKVITFVWRRNQDTSFTCTASNKVSSETSVADISCTEKDLNLYLIITIIGGGVLLFLLLALLIFCIGKKKKLRSRGVDEELEIRTHRGAPEERVRKPPQTPGSASKMTAASQPPPPPGHRPQAPSHRPRPPGHRIQHQTPKKSSPLPPGTQVHQHKGPPLPRPRVQQKLPPGAAGN